MARFHIYPMPGQDRRGYVIDVQANLLDDLKTRAVVPLLSEAASPKPMRNLNPVFIVEGRPHVMLTQSIATLPAKELRGAVAALSAEEQDAATAAIDVLLTGI
jgi:toxin CcdB